MVPGVVTGRAVAMPTLRQIQAVSLRIGPHWFLCVVLGAYVAMHVAAPAIVAG